MQIMRMKTAKAMEAERCLEREEEMAEMPSMRMNEAVSSEMNDDEGEDPGVGYCVGREGHLGSRVKVSPSSKPTVEKIPAVGLMA